MAAGSAYPERRCRGGNAGQSHSGPRQVRSDTLRGHLAGYERPGVRAGAVAGWVWPSTGSQRVFSSVAWTRLWSVVSGKASRRASGGETTTRYATDPACNRCCVRSGARRSRLRWCPAAFAPVSPGRSAMRPASVFSSTAGRTSTTPHGDVAWVPGNWTAFAREVTCWPRWRTAAAGWYAGSAIVSRR